ncbi:hypothetical protein [Pseudoroseicyclus sp. CXY001]|uniref:hypothetical protein n=1 Tax=Pseudoroseicyclus sp. CXY001 TaxID=3242492 RepID=UPI00357095AD
MTATDPVCGMSIDRASAPHMTKHEGTRVYFCSGRRQEKFEVNLAADEGARPKVEAPAGAQWTCQMHPELIDFPPPALDRRADAGGGFRARDERANRPADPRLAGKGAVLLVPGRTGDRRSVDHAGLLPARPGLDPQPLAQHVVAYRHRHRRLIATLDATLLVPGEELAAILP